MPGTASPILAKSVVIRVALDATTTNGRWRVIRARRGMATSLELGSLGDAVSHAQWLLMGHRQRHFPLVPVDELTVEQRKRAAEQHDVAVGRETLESLHRREQLGQASLLVTVPELGRAHV